MVSVESFAGQESVVSSVCFGIMVIVLRHPQRGIVSLLIRHIQDPMRAAYRLVLKVEANVVRLKSRRGDIKVSSYLGRSLSGPDPVLVHNAG